MSDEAAPSAQITFNIKSSSDQKYVVTVPDTMTVLELKQKLSTSEYADVAAERQRLIYSGRVLKDPDALSTYKIKDGNTVHMVKGAASNARQNPGNSSSTVPGAGQPPTGVPANLATGTAANDPMAQLTGARYAGFAQMPGADMFGPDGGMGPPPDPENMLRMLDNPMVASQMQEAMNNPAIIQMMQNNPMIRNNPMMRQMLENPEMRRMLLDPNFIRQSMAMTRMMGGGSGMGRPDSAQAIAPGVTDTTPQGATGTTNTTGSTGNAASTNAQPSANPFGGMGGMFGQGAGGANPFSALFGGAPGGNSNTAGAGQGQNAQVNPFASLFGGGGAAGGPGGMPAFSPEAMQQMMQMFGGGGMGGGFGGAPAAAAPQDTRPPEEMYAEQLRQLNEMGFYEFDRNVRALRMAGGNVQGAIEILFSGGN